MSVKPPEFITRECKFHRAPFPTRTSSKKREDLSQVPDLNFGSLENPRKLFIPFTVVNNVALYGMDNSDMADRGEH